MVSNTHRHDGVCKQAVSSLQDVEASTDIHIPFLLPSSLAENQRLVERHTSVTTVPPLHTCSQITRRVHTHTHACARERETDRQGRKQGKRASARLLGFLRLHTCLSLFLFFLGWRAGLGIEVLMLSLSLCRCFTGVVQAKRSPKVVVSNILNILSDFSLLYFIPDLCHFQFHESYQYDNNTGKSFTR